MSTVCCLPNAYRFASGLVRFVSAFWIGAAVLYVITSVAEQTSPAFDSGIRDQLALIRFPWYYTFAAGVYALTLPAALLCSLLVRPRSGWVIVAALVAVSASVCAYDYFLVYGPLEELINPPGKARTQEFVRLHELSRNINTLHVALMLLAAVTVQSFRGPVPKTQVVPE